MDTTSILLSLAVIGASLVGLAAWLRRRRRRHRRRYQQVLAEALADGTLSAEERAELDRLRREKDLTASEVRFAALAIYRSALRDAARDARLTPEEDEALHRLQRELGLSEADLRADLTQVSRLRMLARAAEGHFPEVKSPVPLVPGEVCHWVVQCTLADRLAVPTAPARAVRGVTCSVLDDTPFSPAPETDLLRPADDILPTDLGMLVITSRRTVFQGARRTLSVPHARVEAVTCYRDGMRIDESRPSAQKYLLVDDAEVTAAILLHAARRRRIEIRPASPRRAAAPGMSA
jgi:LPXTG-motif cell wall-anchored protein